MKDDPSKDTKGKKSVVIEEDKNVTHKIEKIGRKKPEPIGYDESYLRYGEAKTNLKGRFGMEGQENRPQSGYRTIHQETTATGPGLPYEVLQNAQDYLEEIHQAQNPKIEAVIINRNQQGGYIAQIYDHVAFLKEIQLTEEEVKKYAELQSSKLERDMDKTVSNPLPKGTDSSSSPLPKGTDSSSSNDEMITRINAMQTKLDSMPDLEVIYNSTQAKTNKSTFGFFKTQFSLFKNKNRDNQITTLQGSVNEANRSLGELKNNVATGKLSGVEIEEKAQAICNKLDSVTNDPSFKKLSNSSRLNHVVKEIQGTVRKMQQEAPKAGPDPSADRRFKNS